MKVLPEVPALLRGRGSPQSIAVECDCKEKFIWPFRAKVLPQVKCPTCRKVEIITDDAPILNGQVK